MLLPGNSPTPLKQQQHISVCIRGKGHTAAPLTVVQPGHVVHAETQHKTPLCLHGKNAVQQNTTNVMTYQQQQQ